MFFQVIEQRFDCNQKGNELDRPRDTKSEIHKGKRTCFPNIALWIAHQTFALTHIQGPPVIISSNRVWLFEYILSEFWNETKV